MTAADDVIVHTDEGLVDGCLTFQDVLEVHVVLRSKSRPVGPDRVSLSEPSAPAASNLAKHIRLIGQSGGVFVPPLSIRAGEKHEWLLSCFYMAERLRGPSRVWLRRRMKGR